MGVCPSRNRQARPDRAVVGPSAERLHKLGFRPDYDGVWYRRGNTVIKSRRIRRDFRQAVHLLIKILRLREEYARIGRDLQRKKSGDLCEGLKRIDGKLLRIKNIQTR